MDKLEFLKFTVEAFIKDKTAKFGKILETKHSEREGLFPGKEFIITAVMTKPRYIFEYRESSESDFAYIVMIDTNASKSNFQYDESTMIWFK